MPKLAIHDFKPEDNQSIHYDTNYQVNEIICKGRIEGSDKTWLCQQISSNPLTATTQKNQILAYEFSRAISPHQPEIRRAINPAPGGKEYLLYEYQEGWLPIQPSEHENKLVENKDFTGLGQIVAVSLFLRNIRLDFDRMALDSSHRVINKSLTCFSAGWRNESDRLTQFAINDLPYGRHHSRLRWLGQDSHNPNVATLLGHLARSSSFRNEVNQAILKMCLMPYHFTDKLVDACIEKESENKRLKALLNQDRKELITLALDNQSFNDYLSSDSAHQDATGLLAQICSFQFEGIDLFTEDEKTSLQTSFTFTSQNDLRTFLQSKLISEENIVLNDHHSNCFALISDINQFLKTYFKEEDEEIEIFRLIIDKDMYPRIKEYVGKYESNKPFNVRELKQLQEYLLGCRTDFYRQNINYLREKIYLINQTHLGASDMWSAIKDPKEFKKLKQSLTDSLSQARKVEQTDNLSLTVVTTHQESAPASPIDEASKSTVLTEVTQKPNIRPPELKPVTNPEEKDKLVKDITIALDIIKTLNQTLEEKYAENEPIRTRSAKLLQDLKSYLTEYQQDEKSNFNKFKEQCTKAIEDNKKLFNTHRDPWYKKILGYIADCFATLLMNHEEKERKKSSQVFFNSPHRITKSGQALHTFSVQMEKAFQELEKPINKMN